MLTATLSVGCRGIAKGLSSAAKKGSTHGLARAGAHAYRTNSNEYDNDFNLNASSEEELVRSIARTEMRSNPELSVSLMAMSDAEFEEEMTRAHQRLALESPEHGHVLVEELRSYRAELQNR